MIVEIDPKFFAFGAVPIAYLFEILSYAYENRHRIELDESPEVTRWFSERDTAWREEWALARDLGERESAQEVLRMRIRVVPGDVDSFEQPVRRLSLRTARRVLSMPLKVLVENARTDGNMFLRRVATLGQRIDRLQSLVDEQWIEFEGSGGNTEMLEMLRTNREDPRWRLRRFVVFDGDSLRPGEPSATARKLLRRCEALGIPRHCLLRRAAENYLPVPALEVWAERAGNDRITRLQRARSFRDLHQPDDVRERRHHFSMKRGFEGAAHDVDLYEKISERARKVLATGFDSAIRDVFELEHPNWERWLRDDRQVEEIGALLDEVMAYR